MKKINKYTDQRCESPSNGHRKKILLWVVLTTAIILAGATVYAVIPAISLNSPTSFPVDI